MAKNSVADWDTTAANNTDIGGISVQGTANVQNFDNAFRELMAQIATRLKPTTTDNAIARYDGTTGLLQNSAVTIEDGAAQMNFTPASATNVELVNRAADGGFEVFVDEGNVLAFTVTAAGSLQVGSTGASQDSIQAYKNDATYAAIAARQDGAGPVQTWSAVGGAEVARITPDGNLLVGQAVASGSNSGASIRSDGSVVATVDGGASGYFNRLSSDGTLVNFSRSSVTVGSISVTTTATAYNTSSDYRLPWKEGYVPLEGSGAFIDGLKPYYFPLAGHGGFIAHEFQTVSPSSVEGEKDAVDAAGNPIMQTMQPFSPDVMANIVAEVQSLRKRVKALEEANA